MCILSSVTVSTISTNWHANKSWFTVISRSWSSSERDRFIIYKCISIWYNVLQHLLSAVQ